MRPLLLLILLVMFSLLVVSCGSDSYAHGDSTSSGGILDTIPKEPGPGLPEYGATDPDRYAGVVEEAVSALQANPVYHRTHVVLAGRLWEYWGGNDRLDVYTIVSELDDDFRQTETFALRDDRLIFARESKRLFIWNDPPDEAGWSCTYAVRNDSVVWYRSNGHGETESPGWTPDSIINQWRSRKEDAAKVRALSRR